ncbi:hypothetical protein SAMN04489844_1633 [Nocardioides exalbidus]|uniref:Integral membrane protein n=1 Tax=Nocardioides exalbidus TaxID=402596 RepID=A0A1H4PKL3_9ACTN|nr:hypothetical protein SAMN04489844_1633 [Nocardioides exalbidus]
MRVTGALRESTLVDGPLPLALIIASLAFAAVVLVYVVLDRTPDWGLLGFAGVIELATLVLLVVAAVQVGGVDLHGGALVTLFGYLVAGLVLLPIGFVWSLAERSRGATAVLLVAGLAQAFVIVRVEQVWPS